MRKWWVLGGVSLVVVILLGLPLVFGMFTQNLEGKVMGKVNDYLQDKQGSVDKNNFQVLAAFVITEKSYHGPFYVAKDADGKSHMGFGRGYLSATINPDDTTAQWLSTNGVAPKGKYWMSRNAKISLFGNISVKGVMPGLTYTNQAANAKIEVDSVTSRGKISSSLDRVKGEVNVTNFKISNAEGVALIPSIKLKTDNKEKADDLWVGNNKVSIPSMSITQNGNDIFSLSDLSVETNTSYEDDLLGADLNLLVKQFVVEGKDYGPSHYSLAVKNLDEKAWNEIQGLLEQYNQLTQSNNLKVVITQQSYHKGWFTSDATFVVQLGQENTQNPQQLNALAKQTQMMLLTNQIMAQLPDLVSKGATIEMEVQDQKTAQGNIAAKGKVEFPKVAPGESNEPADLVKNATMSLYVKLPEGLTEQLIVSLSGADTPNTATPSDVLAQAKARIESLKQAGYLKTEGDSIIIDILYDKGNLTVNGKSLAAGAGNSVTIPVGAVSNTPAVVPETPATSAAPAANSGDASKATANSDVGTSASTVAPATQQ